MFNSHQEPEAHGRGRTVSHAVLCAMFVLIFFLQSTSGFHMGFTFPSMKTGIRNGNLIQHHEFSVVRPFVGFHAGLRMCAANKDSSKKSQENTRNELHSTIAEGVVDRLMKLSGSQNCIFQPSTNESPQIRSVTQTRQLYDNWLRHRFQEPEMPCSAVAARIVADNDAETKHRDIWATVAGVGRGKTRTLCELTLKLNELPNTLALAISFNSGSSEVISDKEKTFVGYLSRNKRAATAAATKARNAEALLGVATRVWWVATNVTYQSAMDEVKSVIEQVAKEHSVSKVSQLSEHFAEQLLRKLIVSLVEFHRNQTAGNKQGVENFVLLVDESVLGQKLYGVSNLQHLLSQAVVSSENGVQSLESDFGLRGHLVLSALSVKTSGLSDLSGRTVQPISLRDVLDTREIVKEWLPFYAPQWKDIHKNDPIAALKLELLLSTLVELPRGVQAAVRFLRKQNMSALEPANIRWLFGNVSMSIVERYQNFKSGVLPAHILDAIMSKRDLELSDELIRLIEFSVLTSSVKEFSKNTDMERPKVQIRTGICSLWLMARNNEPDNEYLAPVAHMMDALLRHLTNETAQAGFPLEVVVRQVINLRLRALAAQTNGTRSISLYDLLEGSKVEDPKTRGNAKTCLEALGKVQLGPANSSHVLTIDGKWYDDGMTLVYNLEGESDDEFVGESDDKPDDVSTDLDDGSDSSYTEMIVLPNSANTDEFLRVNRTTEFEDAMARWLKNRSDNATLTRLRGEALAVLIPAFLQRANNVILDSKVIVQEVPLAATEGADGAWLMRNAATQETQLLLMDCKSSYELPTNKKKTILSINQVTNQWKQAKHWERVSEMARNMTNDKQLSLRKDSMAEALVLGRYRFVYLSAGHKLPSKLWGDKALYLESKAVEAMMGPFASMYKAVRHLAKSTNIAGSKTENLFKK